MLQKNVEESIYYHAGNFSMTKISYKWLRNPPVNSILLK